jgi:uncharacterized membrane protein YgaE (UPF0421/DUF939 family)
LGNLAYNNAPFAVTWVLDDWVPLNRTQRDWLRPRVESLMAWHRTRELPVYQTLLANAVRDVSKPPSATDIDQIYAESRRAVDRMVEKVLPDAVAFLQTLEPAQIDALERKFNADNQKLERDITAATTDAARKENREKRYVERYESWMGRLNAEQVDIVRREIATIPSSETFRLADRKRWQQEFLRLLRAKPDAAVLERELKVLLLSPELRRAPEYRAAWEAQQRAIIKLTANLLATATPRQQDAVRTKLNGYATDIAALVKA